MTNTVTEKKAPVSYLYDGRSEFARITNLLVEAGTNIHVSAIWTPSAEFTKREIEERCMEDLPNLRSEGGVFYVSSELFLEYSLPQTNEPVRKEKIAALKNTDALDTYLQRGSYNESDIMDPMCPSDNINNQIGLRLYKIHDRIAGRHKLTFTSFGNDKHTEVSDIVFSALLDASLPNRLAFLSDPIKEIKYDA